MRRGHPSSAAVPRFPVRSAAGPVLAYDREWSGRLRTAYASAVSLLAVLLAIDGWDGSLDPLRALAWAALAAAVFAVLLPPRITAGDGWLSVRGLLHERRVHSDYLVLVRFDGVVARRVLLRDAFGTRVELDPHVLLSNPFLWHQLDTAARHAHAAGLLPDTAALRVLSAAIDSAEARVLFSAAGLP